MGDKMFTNQNKEVRVLLWDPFDETSIGFTALVNDDTRAALMRCLEAKSHVFIHNVTPEK